LPVLYVVQVVASVGWVFRTVGIYFSVAALILAALPTDISNCANVSYLRVTSGITRNVSRL